MCHPPGAALPTLICAVPPDARSADVIVACNCEADTKIGLRGLPLNRTTDVGTKFVPLTVVVEAGDPAVTTAGATLVIVGTGFVTRNETALEVPPPGAGFTTVGCTVAALWTSAAVSVVL